MDNNLPPECLLHIFEMALDKDDYWSLSEFVHVYAGIRCLCKIFASTLTWKALSHILSVHDIRTDYIDDTGTTYTKTQAKSTFLLTDKDMDALPCTEKCNPRFRSAHPMKIYTSRVLIQKAKEKYGTRRLMLEHVAARKNRALKRQKTKENIRLQRHDELVEKLGQRGLELRSDSRLCSAYIENGKGDANEIANIMHEMDFYHRYTDYRQIYREIWREEKEYAGWCDPDEVSLMAKSEALRSFALGRTDCPDYVPPTLCIDVRQIQEGT